MYKAGAGRRPSTCDGKGSSNPSSRPAVHSSICDGLAFVVLGEIGGFNRNQFFG